MCHSALMWYLSPWFFSLCYYLATHKETLGCSVVFHLSNIFCLFCKSCVCTPDVFHPRFLSRKLKTRAGTLRPSYTFVRLGAPEPRIRSGGNIRNQYWQQTHGLVCILFFCLHSALAARIWAANASFISLQGGVAHFASWLPPNGIILDFVRDNDAIWHRTRRKQPKLQVWTVCDSVWEVFWRNWQNCRYSDDK